MKGQSPAMKADKEAAHPLIEAIRGASPALAQSRLLNTTDRDLAAVLHSLSEEERAEVLALVGPAKSARLNDELERMEHVRLSPETIRTIAGHLAAHVSGERPLGPASRFFKPYRP
jgi:hypothetical protein